MVVVDKRTGPKSNKNIDQLGFYNPKLGVIEIDAERAKHWLSKGVQPSDTVHNMLVTKKIIDAKKINVLPKKSPIVDEEAIKRAEEEAAAKAEAEKAAAESTEEVSEAETPAEEPAAEEVEAEATEAEAEKKD